MTVKSAIKWREDRSLVAVEIGMDGSDAPEGGVRGSVKNGCQGGEQGV